MGAMTMNLHILSSMKIPITTGSLHPQFSPKFSTQFFSPRLNRDSIFCHEIQLNSRIPGNLLKGFAMRRRRANIQSDTYVLMEPGKNEEFVSEDELREKLKGWLENWPGEALPPDLARFDSVDDAVQYLVKSVCELEIEGDAGSIQWYQVQLD